MSQNNIYYTFNDNDAKITGPTVSIFADRLDIRQEMQEDIENSGAKIVKIAGLEDMVVDDDHPKSDIVICDCPSVGPELCEALSRFDKRSARAGQYIILSTNIDTLDRIFGCFDESSPQILVAVSRAERLIALGRARVRGTNTRLRELSQEDRFLLLQLSEQVERIAEKLDGLPFSPAATSQEGAFRFESPSSRYSGPDGEGGERLVRSIRPPLPDPRLVRRMIQQRQLRQRFFEEGLFADPAWDILLDLTAARAEHKRVSVTSLCIASGVPPTTALRWIGQMAEAGLLQRMEDDTDRRRAFIALTDKAADAMARYFAELGRAAGHPV